MTLSQARSLKPGDILHHLTRKNADGTPQRWKVNGRPQTWKRDPTRIRVPLKHGLYDYDQLYETDLAQGSIGDLVGRYTIVHVKDPDTGRESDYALDHNITEAKARAHVAHYNPGADILSIIREPIPQEATT